ncbi:MAG: hypothetical protein O2840_04930 [bacterium]|nr:hypothetical protein [bacterium]
MTLFATNLGIGKIAVPPGVDKYQDAAAGSGATIGIMLFISMLVKFAMIVAGIWAMLNILLAAYQFFNNKGDAGQYQKVSQQITNTVMGLVLLMSLYTIVAVIGLIFFGDAGYILNPTLKPIP